MGRHKLAKYHTYIHTFSLEIISVSGPLIYVMDWLWGIILSEYPVVTVTGGALHLHSSALVSAEWLVKNVTYRPNCYICFTWDNSVRFLFSERQPFPRWDCFYWQLLETLRAKIGDPTGFDNRLERT